MAADDFIGSVLLGEFEIQESIGVGGMAEVYRAKSTKTGQQTAVKILNGDHARKSKSLERFRREGRLICKINHPSLIRGLAMDEHDGRPFIVMEFIDGPDIDELIRKRGSLHPDEALKILLDISVALNHLFMEGSIQAHRDIKPHNIMVTSGGTAKLTDFGIAKALTDFEQVTMTSSFLGSPHYMSPEQINDPRNVDIRSDIYALGCVFYEMLTGEKAFPGTSAKEILDAHFELEPPSISGSGPLVDGCNLILSKALAFEPSDRFQTPLELINAVQPLVGTDVEISVPRFAKSSIRFAATISAVALVTIMLAVWALASISSSPPTEAKQTDVQAIRYEPTSVPTTTSTSQPTQRREIPKFDTSGKGGGSSVSVGGASGASGGGADSIDPTR